MKSKIAIACLVMGACAPLLSYGADTDADRSSPKAFVKDSVITTKVKAKLAEEKASSLVHIRVDTDNQGIVYLSGTAKSQAAIDRAVTIARGVEGVVSVHNDIRISGS
jgi:hyperosmotically inducible periplasmic protein